jgi:PAS domain S-box-containing protein
MAAQGSIDKPVKVADVSPEVLLNAVVETCDDAIFTADRLGRITTWGAACERLFGRAAAEVIGEPVESLLPEHLRAEADAAMALVAAGERLRHFETEALRPDGLPIPVSMSLCPLLDAGELPTGSVVVVRDVTEQRLAQATLAEIEERLEESEALAHMGSWLWDVRTGAVQWSTEFHRIHGVDPLDFDGTFESHLEPVHPDDRGRVRAQMQRAVASGRRFDCEYRIVRADGEGRLLRVRAQPAMGSARTVVGLRGIGQDITEPGAVASTAVSRDRPVASPG